MVNQHALQLFIQAFNAIQDLLFIIKAETGNFTIEYVNKRGLDYLQKDEGIFGQSISGIQEKLGSTFTFHLSQAANGTDEKRFVEVIDTNKGQSELETVLTPVELDSDIYIIAVFRPVKEKKQPLQQLVESEEKYRKIVRAIPDAIILHRNGIIYDVNEVALHLLKTNEEHVIGKHVLDFVDMRDRQQVVERIENAMYKGLNGKTVEERFVNYAGEVIYADTTSAPVKINGEQFVLVTFKDVTERKLAEKQIRESEERFRIIAEHSMDIIKILDPSGEIMYVSPAIEAVLGYDIQDVVGKSFFKTIYEEDVSDVKQKFSNMIQTKEYFDFILRRVHQDGYPVWLHSDIIPVLDGDGEIEKIIVISGDVSAFKRREEMLSKMAFYDSLTGLPNRRLFTHRLQQAMYTTDRTGNITALLVLDCDKFKQINDTLGHDIGDEVLKEFARRVRSSIRSMDTLSRLGGDEFTIILPELHKKEEVFDISNKIFKKIHAPMVINGESLSITTSIGASFYPGDGTTIENLFKAADENLYKVKENGGDSIIIL
ncbi:bifunctional diguanylate cyclase/phosphodiesterase [Lederbergia graminis]|uniref:Diguanylate cyclase domain-containing protein n=1 Tax=Lederbergia graminis TaxID=735518 RepID=A0ABW0LIF5_9BACI